MLSVAVLAVLLALSPDDPAPKFDTPAGQPTDISPDPAPSKPPEPS